MPTTKAYGLATIVQEPERFPTLIDPERYTGNRVNYDRYRDGADALPTGTPRTHKPGTQAQIIPPELVDDYRAAEIYRVRNMPHLFDDWYRDLVEDARADLVAHMGDVHDWDCRSCQRAVVTTPYAKSCPTCGAPA